jgi:hypothetical protein
MYISNTNVFMHGVFGVQIEVSLRLVFGHVRIYGNPRAVAGGDRVVPVKHGVVFSDLAFANESESVSRVLNDKVQEYA